MFRTALFVRNDSSDLRYSRSVVFFFGCVYRGYRGAISKYSDAIIAAADVPEALAPAYLNRSVAEYKLSNFGRALADAEQSLRILPGNAKAHYRYVKPAVLLMY